jgi:hypothetical protein
MTTTEWAVTLTAEEREYLRELLEQRLKDTQVEEHRTRVLSYRTHILQQEQLLRDLLTKLQEPPG